MTRKTKKMGRPLTTGNYQTRRELERRVRLDYLRTSMTLAQIGRIHGISTATVYRITSSSST